MGLGAFYHAATGIHRRLGDFIHAVVVCRRDEAVREWCNWIRENPMVHPYRWCGSGVLADPARIDEEFRKAWLPCFCRSGQMDTSLEEFDFEVEEWLPLLPEVFFV